METFQYEAHLRTAGGLTVTDITDEVQDAVTQSGISDGSTLTEGAKVEYEAESSDRGPKAVNVRRV